MKARTLWTQRVRLENIQPDDMVRVGASHWVRWDARPEDMSRILQPGQKSFNVRRPRIPRARTLHRMSHGRKVQHRSWLSAWWHARRLNRLGDRQGFWRVYPCQWRDEWRQGPTGPRHWHVGRLGRTAVYAMEVRRG